LIELLSLFLSEGKDKLETQTQCFKTVVYLRRLTRELGSGAKKKKTKEEDVTRFDWFTQAPCAKVAWSMGAFRFTHRTDWLALPMHSASIPFRLFMRIIHAVKRNVFRCSLCEITMAVIDINISLIYC